MNKSFVFDISYTNKANRDIKRFGTENQTYLKTFIEGLAKNPYSNCIKLKDKSLPGTHRIKKDFWRIFVSINKRKKHLTIETVKIRDGNTYKKR